MWLYESVEFNEVPDDIIGFVYRITNLKTGREYIGKKLFNPEKFYNTWIMCRIHQKHLKL